MVSEIYRQGSIAVYAAATARFAAAGTRHEIEQAAKMAIVAEVFGPLELCHRADGSPFIPGSGASISVSHCQTLVVLAADRLRRNIGIDCETSSRGAQLGRVAAKFLSPAQSLAWGTDEKTSSASLDAQGGILQGCPHSRTFAGRHPAPACRCLADTWRGTPRGGNGVPGKAVQLPACGICRICRRYFARSGRK